MNAQDSIAQRLAAIRQEIPETVQLVAVSKGASVEQMREAYAAGVRDFGESRIQATAEKQAALADLSDIHWHLIGQLQSNKVRKAVQMFDVIQSVDSLKLYQQINKIAIELGKAPQVYLQVKMLPDPQKTGWNVAQLWLDLPEINRCKHLRATGLMIIAPLELDTDNLLKMFTSAFNLQKEINQHNYQFVEINHLSMGMSQDYKIAVRAGSSTIRLGSKIFAL
jgi:PLP dependent protein